MRRSAVVVLLLAFCCPPLLAQPAPDARAAALDAFVARGMADWKLPGLSLVVVHDGAVAYQKGFGVRELGEPGAVDADTLFGMMSTTKALVATAMAMLVDEGKVGWDDPVAKHLPWFVLPDPYLTRHVTVRDALRHSSGMANADLLWAREDLSTREILERMRTAPTLASLRSGWEYQNVLYQVAGEIVTAASGMPWQRFVETRIFAPLGMTRSYTSAAAVATRADANTSRPHYEIDGAVRVIEESLADRVPAAGAAWTTARDAGKWIAFLLAGGEVDGQRLVSEENFREMFRPQFVTPPTYPTASLVGSRFLTYGLGWFLLDYRGMFVAMHTGSLDGRIAIAGLVPERKLGVYVLGNLDHAEFRHALLWKVIDLWTDAPERDWHAEVLALYRGLQDKAKQAVAKRESARIAGTRPSHALADYAGRFVHETWGPVDVAHENGQLVLRLGPSPQNAGRLEHWHHDTFRVKLGDGRGGWMYLLFGQGADGTIRGLEFAGAGWRFDRVN